MCKPSLRATLEADLLPAIESDRDSAVRRLERIMVKEVVVMALATSKASNCEERTRSRKMHLSIGRSAAEREWSIDCRSLGLGALREPSVGLNTTLRNQSFLRQERCV